MGVVFSVCENMSVSMCVVVKNDKIYLYRNVKVFKARLGQPGTVKMSQPVAGDGTG